MAPGARNKFGARMFEPKEARVLLKKVLATLLGSSASPAVVRRPHSDSAPGELCSPLTPRYASGWVFLHSEVQLRGMTWLEIFWRSSATSFALTKHQNIRVCAVML